MATLLLNDQLIYVQVLFFISLFFLLTRLQQRITSKNDSIKGINHFNLQVNGCCIFYDDHHVKVQPMQYQLAKSSRVSVLGCWLCFEQQSGNAIITPLAHANKPPQHWFVYRDSLSAQDYSRLTRVINNLSLIKDSESSN